MTYICPDCNCRGGQLHRLFGTWPPVEFTELSSAKQEEFWANPCDSLKAVQDLVVDTLAKNQITRKAKMNEGEFQPLEYWEKLGYDPERIRADTPENQRQWHAQLGETFNVVITKTSDGKSEEEVKGKILKRRKVKDTRGARPSFLADDASDEEVPPKRSDRAAAVEVKPPAAAAAAGL